MTDDELARTREPAAAGDAHGAVRALRRHGGDVPPATVAPQVERVA